MNLIQLSQFILYSTKNSLLPYDHMRERPYVEYLDFNCTFGFFQTNKCNFGDKLSDFFHTDTVLAIQTGCE